MAVLWALAKRDDHSRERTIAGGQAHRAGQHERRRAKLNVNLAEGGLA